MGLAGSKRGWGVGCCAGGGEGRRMKEEVKGEGGSRR